MMEYEITRTKVRLQCQGDSEGEVSGEGISAGEPRERRKKKDSPNLLATVVLVLCSSSSNTRYTGTVEAVPTRTAAASALAPITPAATANHTSAILVQYYSVNRISQDFLMKGCARELFRV